MPTNQTGVNNFPENSSYNTGPWINGSNCWPTGCTPSTADTGCNNTSWYGNTPATGNTYRVGDLVQKFCETGVRLWQMACRVGMFKSIPYMFFDQTEILDPGKAPRRVLTFKNIPGIEHTISETGNSVKWYEQWYQFPESTVAVAGTSVNTITLIDAAKFNISDEILIYATDGVDACCATEYQRQVTAINYQYNTITFNGTAITVALGDRVQRLYEVLNNCDAIVASPTLDDMEEYESFYSNFGQTIQFSEEDLNKCYATAGGVQWFVDSYFMKMNEDQLWAIGNTIWRGRNVKPVNGLKTQSMGIINGIDDTIANYGLSLRADFKNLTTDDQRIKALLDQIYLAQQCGVKNMDPIIIGVCTHRAYNNLTKMNQAWNRILGCVPTCSSSMEKQFNIYSISGPFGRVEFTSDAILNTYYRDKSVIILMPKNQMKLYMKQNRKVNEAGGLDKVVTGFEFDDITYLYKDKFRCGNVFKMTGQFSIILVGLKSGAWRIIENL